jgi:hypothetical protein
MLDKLFPIKIVNLNIKRIKVPHRSRKTQKPNRC